MGRPTPAHPAPADTTTSGTTDRHRVPSAGTGTVRACTRTGRVRTGYGGTRPALLG